MKILFVSSVLNAVSAEKPLGSLVQSNFGVSYISSYLKQFGHDTELLVLGRDYGDKNYGIIRKKLDIFKPDIIGFYSVTTQYRYITSVSKFIKSNYPDTFLVIGGPHATLNAETVIEDPFDAICIGEGERPMLKVAEMLAKDKFPSNISNLWIKNKKNIEKNPTASYFENLDELPFPDRNMWEGYLENTESLSEQNFVILLGRGCPYNCTYCCNHAFRKIADGNYVRVRSPQNIVREIKSLHEKYSEEKSFYFEIESFNANKKWAIKVCDEIERYNNTLETPLYFGLNIRITQNADFDNLFEACVRANITYINIGIESGSERVRKEILKRNYSNEDIMRTIDLAKKHGLEYNFYTLIGIPGETIKDYKETLNLCRICQPKIVAEHIYYPYPGTSLYDTCEEMGLLPDKKDIKMERRQAIMSLPGFNINQIQRAYIWFNYNVYKGYRPRVKLLLRVLSRYLNQNSFFSSILLKFFYSSLIIRVQKFIKRFYPL